MHQKRVCCQKLPKPFFSSNFQNSPFVCFPKTLVLVLASAGMALVWRCGRPPNHLLGENTPLRKKNQNIAFSCSCSPALRLSNFVLDLILLAFFDVLFTITLESPTRLTEDLHLLIISNEGTNVSLQFIRQMFQHFPDKSSAIYAV